MTVYQFTRQGLRETKSSPELLLMGGHSIRIVDNTGERGLLPTPWVQAAEYIEINGEVLKDRDGGVGSGVTEFDPEATFDVTNDMGVMLGNTESFSAACQMAIRLYRNNDAAQTEFIDVNETQQLGRGKVRKVHRRRYWICKDGMLSCRDIGVEQMYRGTRTRGKARRVK